MPAAANIHLIVGEEDYLAEATARKIVEAAVPADLRASAVETIDGNAANEEACYAFLRGEIPFGRIPQIVEAALQKHGALPAKNLDDIDRAEEKMFTTVPKLKKKKKKE